MKNKLLPKAIIIVLFFSVIPCINREAQSDSNIVITKIGAFSTGSFAFDVRLKDDVAFVADLSSGLNIINVSDPTSPELISLYEMESAHKVFIDENIAYVSNWNDGFEIINITDY